MSRHHYLLGLGILIFSTGMSGCAALTFPAADGVPARLVPPELLAPSRTDEQPLVLTLLGQPRPQVYRVAAGDVLAVYVDGILGDRAQPLPIHVPPLIQPRNERVLPPAVGVPVPIHEDGTIALPLVDPLKVQGMSVAEVREAVRKLYLDKQLLPRGNERILVGLLQPRMHQVLVLREEAASFGFGFEGPVPVSKRGVGHELNMPAYENDVLHALTVTGGLPGLDAANAVIIQRGCFADGGQRTLLRQTLEALAAGTQVPCLAQHGVQTIRIPLRGPAGAPVPFRPEDVILQTGDVVYIEARDDDVFYSGGLLPPGVHVLPRDHDLDVLEAVASVRGPLFNGAFGGSNLSGAFIQPGIGNPSPSLLLVLRRTPGGGQVRILVDLNRALVHPQERIIVQAGDVLLLQEQPREALSRYVTQTFFNFNLIWQAVRGRFVSGVVDVSTPDRLPGRLPTATIPLER